MKKTKLALLHSVIALLLCCSMLIGTTFAWFTDSVTSGINRIAAGNLDVELEYLDKNGNWKPVREDTNVFAEDTLWEPGHTEVVYLKISNLGSLALKYRLGVNIVSETPSLNKDNGLLKLSDHIRYGIETGRDGKTNAWADRTKAVAAVSGSAKPLSTGYTGNGKLYAQDNCPTDGQTEHYVAMVVYMPETVGNEANYKTGENPPEIELGISLVATQQTAEQDSFGTDYDEQAKFPTLKPGSVTVDVQTENGKVSQQVTMEGETILASVPAGVKVKDGVGSLTLSVSEMSGSNANIPLEENEILRSLDVHMEGVAADNTVPMLITVEKAMMTGLNIGNYTLYHVENGAPVQMTYVSALADLDAHNEFFYDPATGDVTMALATFSEVAFTADSTKAWEGNFDYSWYKADATELTIANADQLAAFGAIVGGMNGQTQDSFSGKTVKLIADINLGDDEEQNNPDIIFYPIGYWNNEGTYERKPLEERTTAVESGFYTFEGTFDGNGNTISNFYQNTWEMKGDHNWYDPIKEQYYRDGMGLFGKVYGGTVKNLTVKNFSSDGEITTTGVIAAYADGATFENIAIFNCNPRVYNIGNGGIVGCVGWYAKEPGLKTTFTNITVDNSNKISALWGSYDVACGGILGQYYPTSGQTSAGTPKNGGIEFTNCHVSAVMDVYNDVCANYQYYAYRYTGMLIGSVRENETIDGHVYPKMDGITASGCTVHFGDWNDYYYCELVANTTASYTHDHQMSRLTQVASVDVENMKVIDLDGKTTDIPTSDRVNYVVVKAKDANGMWIHGDGASYATCYHFVDGAVWKHENAGYHNGENGEKYIDENGDGVADLKEDKQLVYREFNQLFTGYGWGVTSKGVDDLAGVTILDREVGNSVEKFEGKVNELANNKEYKLGDIFSFVDNGVELVPGALIVSVTNLDENNPVSATIVYDRNNWENSTLTLSGTGNVQINIQDYYFCTPTTIELTVTNRQAEDKFETKFNNTKFTYRVGNDSTTPVKLDSLFQAVVSNIGTVAVTIEKVNGNADGTYSAATTWTNGIIKFSGTGLVKVTITDHDYCIPTELILEVVDAKNATTVTSATANNVVLLNDCGFSSLEVSNGYALYGNGFTMTCGSDSASLSFGEFVKLDSGTLDNVQIVCPNYDYAALYNSQLKDMEANRSETTNGTTRYYNAKSAVAASGNSQILNSRISGGRAALYASNGNIVIDNSRIEGGAVATVLISAANSIVFRDTTLVQKPTESTYRGEDGKSPKTLMGMSVLYLCDADGNATPTTLEGTFVQYAWADNSCAAYMPEGTSNIASTVLEKGNYTHAINEKTCVNLGFAYMPNEGTTVNQPSNINDERLDYDTIPYGYESVSASVPTDIGLSVNISTYVYSYTNTRGTSDSFKSLAAYIPNKYSDIVAVNYSDATEGLTANKSYGTDGWIYELNVDLDKINGYQFDFSKLTMSVNGVAVTEFTVNGSAKPTSPIAVTAGGVTYSLKATVNGKEYTATYIVTGVETSKRAPYLVDKDGNEITEDSVSWGTGVCVIKSGDYSGAAPVLEGIYVCYWSVAEGKYKTIELIELTPKETGKINGTNDNWSITADNSDYTLTVTSTNEIHDSKNLKGMPVVYDNVLYFTISSADGMVSSVSGARNIAISYLFEDNNGGTLDFAHTWVIGYDKDNSIDYDTMCGNESECVSSNTKVTLADGSQKEIQFVTYDDVLLVWDFYNGTYAKMPASIIWNHGEAEYDVTSLYFDDGTVVEMINSHGFFDAKSNNFVYITDENVADYMGHDFVKADGDSYTTVKLVNYFVERKYTGCYSIQSAVYNNFIVESMFSMTTPDYEGWFDYFRINDDMKYDEAHMKEEIEKYGICTYEEVSYLGTYEQYVALNAQYLKILIGRGVVTMDEVVEMLKKIS